MWVTPNGWAAVLMLAGFVAGAIAGVVRLRTLRRRADLVRERADEAERQDVLRSLAAADYARSVTPRRRNGGGR